MNSRCELCMYWNAEIDEYDLRANLGLGKCKKVALLWDATDWAEDGLSLEFTKEGNNLQAFVQDGSDYIAYLYTRPEFYCAQFAPQAEKSICHRSNP